MSSCTDKRFETMLHAFELDMLDEHDYEQFQLHILECEYCFERAQKMADAAEILRANPDIREIPRQVVEEQPEAAPTDKAWRFRLRFWPTLVPATVMAAAVLLFLIFRPWQIEINPGQDAVAAGNRLAVLPFDNLADPDDPQRLGEITTSLLITDLSESRFVRVVSSRRLYDILRLLGHDDDAAPDNELAGQAARRAGAKWMLTGSLLQIEPHIELTAEIADVATGDVVASQRITGEPGDDIFALVDRLTVLVKRDLSLPVEAQRETDRPVADVTTHSPEAYRYYLEGIVNYYRLYNDEAIASFKKAISVDSTFAMAYYYLSLTDDENLVTEAMKHIDHARRVDGYFIRSRKAMLTGQYDEAIRELLAALEENPDDKEAHYRIGIAYSMKLEFDESIAHYRRAVEIDPLYKIVYNQMAYTYDWMGDLDEAIEAINMYISLAPDEPNPYDSRGDIYTTNGRLRDAIASYRLALDVKPDFWASLYKLGKNHLLLGEFTAADSCFEALTSSSNHNWRVSGLAAHAYVPLYQGRFGDAQRLLDDGIAATGDTNPFFHYLKAVAYQETGDPASALREHEESIRLHRRQFPRDSVYGRHLLAEVLARSGDFDGAEAAAELLRRNCHSERDTLRYWYAVASIDWARGNKERAILGFEKAAEDSVIPYTPANYLLARAYMETGRWTDAITECQKILTNDFTDNRLCFGSMVARVHYVMGVSYEELGRIDRAREQYRLFIDIWKDADPGQPMLDDARERLARLSGES